MKNRIIAILMALAMLMLIPAGVLAETTETTTAAEMPGEPPEGMGEPPEGMPGEPPEGMGEPPEGMPGEPPEGMGQGGPDGMAMSNTVQAGVSAALRRADEPAVAAVFFLIERGP